MTLVAAVLPALLGILVLTVDCGMLQQSSRAIQQVCDAAATAAARELSTGAGSSTAIATAIDYVKSKNGLSDAQVVVNIPPESGPFAGQSHYVEVCLERSVPSYLAGAIGAGGPTAISARGVAGAEPSTSGAAIVVLDPTPAPITIPVLSLLSLSVPPLNVAGLEILGLGCVNVDGAVLVNTEWGGVNQNNDPVGANSLPYGVCCTPILPLTRLKCRDLRVVGGVDNRNCYQAFSSGGSSPLKAGRLPVPDPFRSLPVPTSSADSVNVSSTNHGGVSVTGLPLLGPTRHLYPGVYDWIQVLSGKAVFHPGIYVIRGKNPLTQISLSMAAGQITANGVMFYITNSAGFSVMNGSPDNADGEAEPANPGLTTQIPSVVINTTLLGSQITGLNAAGSPFNGMLIYQRRQDRRPIVIAADAILGTGQFSGTLYAKWGQILFQGQGTYDVKLVGGTVRFLDVLGLTIKPTVLLDPARDVFLVE